MDEVMVDHLKMGIKEFNSHFNKNLRVNDLQGKRITD